METLTSKPPSFLNEITPTVIACNEEDNLPRTLAKLTWAQRVLVVDSYSTDKTLAICAQFPNVEVMQRKFDNPSAQLNFGLSHVHTEWVMVLGADFVLTDGLVQELSGLSVDKEVVAYMARFVYCVNGVPLRGTIYPSRELIFRTQAGQFIQEGHTELLRIQGRRAWLSGRVLHDDRKSLDRWFMNQIRYSAQEARHLMETPPSELNTADRIRRKIVLAPALVFFHTLLGKGLILDGWAGWHYVFQRTLVELMRSLRLADLRVSSRQDSRPDR